MSEVMFRKNEDEQRYEALLDNALAGYADYRVNGASVLLPHTVVDSAYEGRGIGGGLVRYALDDISGSDLQVVPQCPFVASWIDQHPEYRHLLAD
ncbi:GNAT family N-acetyltransferase [Dermacoccaceae bacterium W4C1]